MHRIAHPWLLHSFFSTRTAYCDLAMIGAGADACAHHFSVIFVSRLVVLVLCAFFASSSVLVENDGSATTARNVACSTSFIANRGIVSVSVQYSSVIIVGVNLFKRCSCTPFFIIAIRQALT